LGAAVWGRFSLCFLCAFSVLSLCFLCAFSVLSLCFLCAFSVLSVGVLALGCAPARKRDSMDTTGRAEAVWADLVIMAFCSWVKDTRYRHYCYRHYCYK
jgi:hypothetical protein